MLGFKMMWSGYKIMLLGFKILNPYVLYMPINSDNDLIFDPDCRDKSRLVRTSTRPVPPSMRHVRRGRSRPAPADRRDIATNMGPVATLYGPVATGPYDSIRPNADSPEFIPIPHLRIRPDVLGYIGIRPVAPDDTIMK